VDKPEESRSDLSSAVVRICPACCTVNPSAPSAACPHVQLVRFDGLSSPLEALLTEVAAARREYNELNAKLRTMVLDAVREGGAEVETARKPRGPEGDAVQEAAGRLGSLSLSHSGTGASAGERVRAAPKRRKTGAPPVDPRQLTLLAFSPPKGDA
jgi:hypothetical protein